MKRLASTRSEEPAWQPGLGRAQWSVGSIEDDGIRYGFTTHALIASTAATAIAIVTAQSTIVSQGAGSDEVRRSSGPLTTASLPAPLAAPRLDEGMVAGEEHLRDPPASKLGRASCSAGTRAAFERRREALHRAALLADRPGKPPCDRVQQHHRRQLAAGEDVRADRDGVGGDVLEDALVEALEAGRERVSASSSASSSTRAWSSWRPCGREGDHPAAAALAVDGLERGADDVHAQHHPGAAAVRLVVHLAAGERRVVAVVEEAQIELRAEHRRDRALLGQPREGVRKQGEDVDLHRVRD